MGGIIQRGSVIERGDEVNGDLKFTAIEQDSKDQNSIKQTKLRCKDKRLGFFWLNWTLGVAVTKKRRGKNDPTERTVALNTR